MSHEFCGIKKKLRKKLSFIFQFKNKIKSCKTLQNKYLDTCLNEMTIKYAIKEDKKIQIF